MAPGTDKLVDKVVVEVVDKVVVEVWLLAAGQRDRRSTVGSAAATRRSQEDRVRPARLAATPLEARSRR